MDGNPIIIPHSQLKECRDDLGKEGRTGQWIVVHRKHPKEQSNRGPVWEHRRGCHKNLFISATHQFSIAMETYVPNETPHWHAETQEVYNFRGYTKIMVIRLGGNTVDSYELETGGYVIFTPGDYCHWIVANTGGWDMIQFRALPTDGQVVDKTVCQGCPFHGKCLLEQTFRFQTSQSSGHQDSSQS